MIYKEIQIIKDLRDAKKPYVVMAIGLPASGKSTAFSGDARTVYVSSDFYIENAAANAKKTYNEMFKELIKPATEWIDHELNEALYHNYSVYWDQTNLTAKSRKPKLAKFPDKYTKIALVFPTPPKDIWEARLTGRPGKNIPQNIIDSMAASFELPTKEEGFEHIIEWKDAS